MHRKKIKDFFIYDSHMTCIYYYQVLKVSGQIFCVLSFTRTWYARINVKKSMEQRFANSNTRLDTKTRRRYDPFFSMIVIFGSGLKLTILYSMKL